MLLMYTFLLHWERLNDTEYHRCPNLSNRVASTDRISWWNSGPFNYLLYFSFAFLLFGFHGGGGKLNRTDYHRFPSLSSQVASTDQICWCQSGLFSILPVFTFLLISADYHRFPSLSSQVASTDQICWCQSGLVNILFSSTFLSNRTDCHRFPNLSSQVASTDQICWCQSGPFNILFVFLFTLTSFDWFLFWLERFVWKFFFERNGKIPSP